MSVTDEFLVDLQRAFSSSPRSISPKYFYDTEGSQLFDRICELPEYYPTRTELKILQTHADEMAGLMGAHAEIVEFGAGSLIKIRLLLDALDRPASYSPMDISAEHLSLSCATLQQNYPDLHIAPWVADYTRNFTLPSPQLGKGKRIGFFPGSTIGNFSPPEALDFLRKAALALRGGALLLGADLIKHPDVLHAAYNDAQGVTAAFNLNLLARANRELGTNFDLDKLDHSAFYNAPFQRIEMHLVSRSDQTIQLGNQQHTWAQGDTLHTENSYKFTVRGLQTMAQQAGFTPGPVWTDSERLFSVHWLHAPD